MVKSMEQEQAIHQVLESKGLNDVVIFVRRRYGGHHLGPKRSKIIKQCATELINKQIKLVVYDISDPQTIEKVLYPILGTP